MGELYASEANAIRSNYIRTYRNIKEKVNRNFQDMDFDNARQRDDMEEIVTKIKEVCDNCCDELSGMEFL